MSEKDKKDEKPQYGLVSFERRRNPRFSIDLPIEYSRANSSVKNAGHTGNVSEGGLMLYLPERVEVGHSLRVKIFFVSEPGLYSIEVLAQVAWTELPYGQEEHHRCGVKFVEICPEDLNRLKTFLNNLSFVRPPFRITP
jgi:c-di-GMP-binding flagellar brake protein YcgR